MNWNGTGVDTVPLEITILVPEIVVVDLLAMSNIEEKLAGDGATANILKDPLRRNEAKTITQQIVPVLTGVVAKAIVLLQKEIQEIRVGVVQKGTEDVGRGAIVVAKDPSKRLSFLKNEYKNVATKLILLSRGNSNIRSKICD